MKVKLISVIVFVLTATLLAFAIYANNDVEFTGSVTVKRSGVLLSLSEIEDLEENDVIETKEDGVVKIKGEDFYYYVPEDSSVLIGKSDVSIISGILYKSLKAFKSLDDFIEYDDMLGIYADPYPFRTGEFASIYLTHKDELDIVSSRLKDPRWPISTFFKVDSSEEDIYVYRSVVGMHISWQDNIVPLSVNMNVSENLIIDILIDMETITKPLPERPKQLSGVNKKMIGILSDAKKSQAERELLQGSVYTNFSDTNYITSPYSMPTTGRETSIYGAFRGYRSNYARFHEGYDLANVTGTPIYAANSGLVRISRELFVRGNCVIIDHGQGVYSSYFHMSKLIAEEGSYVEKGELIGLIGTTGMSTGPHLHWEMRAGNVTFDPLTVIDRTLSFDESSLVKIK